MEKRQTSTRRTNGARQGQKQGASSKPVDGEMEGMSQEAFDKLFLDNIKDVYHAEKQLVRALPRMAKEATTPELKSALVEHLAVRVELVKRLEQVFSLLGEKPATKVCKGMAGLIEEGKELFEEDLEAAVLDCGIIGAAQKVEHYEIAAYGTLRALAEQKGEQKIVDLLQQSLDEEFEADKTLTGIAESSINVMAASE
jgi:ferritin-like metal-binding protein YciE